MSGLCPVSTFGSLLFFLCAMHEERRVLVRYTQGFLLKGKLSLPAFQTPGFNGFP